MGSIESSHQRPRVFNTPFETGLRSVVILTACYPERLSLHRLVVFDYLIVHSGDIDGPESMHPMDRSRAAEILVRRSLVSSGLALMETRGLVARTPTRDGFRYRAGDDAGSFVDLLRSPYIEAMKDRADWLAEEVLPLSEAELADLLRDRIDAWAPEFQISQNPSA